MSHSLRGHDDTAHSFFTHRSEEEMKRNHTTQVAENKKTQAAIAILKTDKTNLHQHLLDLKRRVAELELQIGEEPQAPSAV